MSEYTNKPLKLSWVANIDQQILSALACLHNQKPNPLVHCDIKPANILLTVNKHGFVRAKLADYDSVHALQGETTKSGDFKSATYTERYMSPERAKGVFYGKDQPGRLSDIWIPQTRWREGRVSLEQSIM